MCHWLNFVVAILIILASSRAAPTGGNYYHHQPPHPTDYYEQQAPSEVYYDQQYPGPQQNVATGHHNPRPISYGQYQAAVGVQPNPRQPSQQFHWNPQQHQPQPSQSSQQQNVSSNPFARPKKPSPHARYATSSRKKTTDASSSSLSDPNYAYGYQQNVANYGANAQWQHGPSSGQLPPPPAYHSPHHRPPPHHPPAHYEVDPYRQPTHYNAAGPAGVGAPQRVRPAGRVRVQYEQQQSVEHGSVNDQQEHSDPVLALPPPTQPQQLPPDLMGFDDTVQDLLTDVNPAESSLMNVMDDIGGLSLEDPKQKNLKGTGEVFYDEQTMHDKEGKTTKLEIYRQRDNSGKYIKFRFVDQLSKITMYSCIAPLPKPPQKLELYFNNDQSTPFTFDSTGYLMAKEEQFQMDAFSGKPNQQVVDKRLYDYKEFQAWIAPVINDMLEEEEPVYPSGNILQWVGMPLPVHPSLFLDKKKKFGFSKEDVKKGNPRATKGLDEVKEQMDDEGNWIRIEIAQSWKSSEEHRKGTSHATFLRDLRGNAPVGLTAPILLSFNGRDQYFDKTGMAIGEFAVEALKRKPHENLVRDEEWPMLKKMMEENLKLQKEEEEKKEEKEEEKDEKEKEPPKPVKDYPIPKRFLKPKVQPPNHGTGESNVVYPPNLAPIRTQGTSYPAQTEGVPYSTEGIPYQTQGIPYQTQGISYQTPAGQNLQKAPSRQGVYQSWNNQPPPRNY